MAADDSKERPRRNWKRRLAWAAVLLIGALLLAHGVWGWAAQRRLDATVARLRAAGEPMTPADLPAGTVADGDNVAVDYRAAMALVDKTTSAWDWWDKRSEPRAYEFPLRDDERADLNAIATANAAALQRLTTARTKDPAAADWRVTFTTPLIDGIGALDYKQVRSLSNLLRVAAFDAQARGRSDEAIAFASDSVRVGAAARYPYLVGGLVGTGIRALGADTVALLAPELAVGTVPGQAAPDAVRQLIDALLDERAAREAIRYAWQTERMMLCESFTRFAQGLPMQLVDAAGNPVPPRTAGQQVSAKLAGYATGPLVLSDAAAMLQYLQGVIDAHDQPSWPAAEAAIPTAFPEAVERQRARHFLAALLVPSLSRAVEVHYRSLADRRLAAAALAVRLYRADHDGTLPPTLAALVPAYLPAVPLDPLTAASPIGYVADPANPRLYHVGANGADDGGRDEDPTASNSQNRATTDRVVYLQTRPRPPAAPPIEQGDVEEN